jgi:YwiC-like protein
MVVPREHGAWGMLLVPFATGTVVALYAAANTAAVAVFLVAVLTLFWLRTPAEAWLGTSPIKASSGRERSVAAIAALTLGSVAVGAAIALILDGHLWGLCAIAAVVTVSFCLQTLVRRAGRRGRMPAQVIGALGLTSTAAGAYYVATGHLDRVAGALWLANWLFAWNQIQFVQLRIRSSRTVGLQEKMRQGDVFLAGQLALLVFVVVFGRMGFLPKFAALAFVPAVVRGTQWFFIAPGTVNVHRLGFSELFQSVLFGAILCAVFAA